nr:M48 family metallopeptidase [Prevotella sp.]
MNNFKNIIIIATAGLLLSACGTTQTVPITGRKHHISVSDEQVLSLSKQQYSQYMASAKKSSDVKNTEMVIRVGKKLAAAVETYLQNNGYSSEIKNFNWEFNLVSSSEANAFCMPGGKIVVYEGLLPYTKTETALAIVLGHEIAHAVAKHSAEQMSKQQNQSIFTQIGASAIGVATGSNDLGNIAGSVAQNAFSFANLKYNRNNENEADHMGLIFAAMAGYNPEEAIPFWQRMSQGKSSSTNDIFSTHPSDATRIANLKKEMPEADKYYRIATGKEVAPIKSTPSQGSIKAVGNEKSTSTTTRQTNTTKSVKLDDLVK